MNRLFILSAYTAKMNATGWLVPVGLILGAILDFVFGTKTMAGVFVGMLILDFITGIIASSKRGEKIESCKIRDMYYKWMIYLVILLVGALLDICTGTVWLHGAAFGWVILSEGVSVLENCEGVLGKKLPFLGKVRKILDALKGAEDEDSIPTDNTVTQDDQAETIPPDPDDGRQGT